MSSRQNQLPDPNSRSQRKVELEELRQLGMVLMDLPPGKFAKVTLPDELREAVAHGRSLTDLNARRRQLQYIQAEIDRCDATLIRKHLERVDRLPAQPKAAAPAAAAHPEAPLAAALLDAGDPAVFALSSRFDATELQSLRQAVRRARKDLQAGKSRDDAMTAVLSCLTRLTPLQ